MELSHHSSMATQWQRGMVAIQKHHQNGNGTSMYCQVFSGGSDGKGSAHSAGDLGLIPGLGRSFGGGHGNPPQYSWLENPHGQRSLAGPSPWGRKEPDITERLSTAQHSSA